MNKNTKQRKLRERKAKLHYFGSFCYTDFKDKDKNPANKRTKPWKPKYRPESED